MKPSRKAFCLEVHLSYTLAMLMMPCSALLASSEVLKAPHHIQHFDEVLCMPPDSQTPLGSMAI